MVLSLREVASVIHTPIGDKCPADWEIILGGNPSFIIFEVGSTFKHLAMTYTSSSILLLGY
jgi:hypothetical protein